MQASSSVPHGGWTEVLPYLLVWLFGVSTRWIPLWQNRKKPAAEIHETHARAGKAEAETRKIDAEASKSFGEVIVALSDKITEAHEEIESARDRHSKQVEFLQSQIQFKTESEQSAREAEQVARIRAHRAIAEVQRCVMTIRNYEEAMRKEDLQFETFEFRSYEDIMGTSTGKMLEE